LKHKETRALKERKEQVAIIRGALQNSAYELASGQQERARVKGF